MDTRAYKNAPCNQKSGFTLVELMVSVSIFAVVATMSVSTLLIMIDANRKAQALAGAMTNVSFVADSITRNIRTGYDYYCDGSGSISALPAMGATNDCSGGNNIVFTAELTSDRVGYRLDNGAIQRKINNGSWLQVTSNDVVINAFEVTVVNSEDYYGEGNAFQPKVYFFIEGEVTNNAGNPTTFSLQTNVVQRVLDY